MGETCSHAVVLGAGIAGLLAARVLSEFYESVTVVERDALPDHPDQRTGVPQGRHLHTFLSRGTQVIGAMFPGVLGEFAAAGAVVDDGQDLSRLCVRVAGYELNRTGRLTDPEPLAAYQASRPFMEFYLRRRVAALGNVAILDNHDAVEPVVDGDTVTGMRLISRGGGGETALQAQLVVDATGRAARAMRYLNRLGFDTAPAEQIPSTGGYSSQLLSIPAGRIAERMVFINNGSSGPGALLVAYEHDTWMLSIARPVEYGSPPADFAEMLAEANKLLPATIMSGLRDAEPVGAISIARTTAAVWRRYDLLTRLPAGLVVFGDALCHLNPLYGQGMTMSALQALALRDCLRESDTDLPQRFYRAATDHIGPVWAVNRASDRPPVPSSARTPKQRLRSSIQLAALKAASTDIAVAERLLRVRGLIDPPARLQEPSLFARILWANLRHRVT
jgi:2-polyprenyl-6-methoxyphenol hydroxylase-like FAD-dependent oxidoreductase